MKVISWNVNGLRAVERKGELQSFLDRYTPDIFLMQEIKGSSDKFSAYLNTPPDYEVFYNPAEKAGYAGTGVWIREPFRRYVKSVQTGFLGDPTPSEWRVIHVTLEKENDIIDIFGVYFPNGGKSEEAWHGKLAFYEAFSACMDQLRAEGHMVIWGGDINCAHNEIDLARAKENDGKIGFHPLERAWLDDRTNNAWLDVWRVRNPDEIVYSWWDQKTKARERNIGWRIDALWADEKLEKKITEIVYLGDQYGSDHCPMLADIDF